MCEIQNSSHLLLSIIGEDMNMVLTSGAMPLGGNPAALTNGLTSPLAPMPGMVPTGLNPAVQGLINTGLHSPMGAVPTMTAQLPTGIPGTALHGQTVMSPSVMGMPQAAPMQRSIVSPGNFSDTSYTI